MTFWQVALQVVPFGGSQVSGGTMQLSPQTLGLQALATQMSPPLGAVGTEHAAHMASTVPVPHFCPLFPVGPERVWQTWGVALHGSALGHTFEESGFVEQLNVQSGSQPEPVTLFDATQSHCSPGSRVPLPQLVVTQRWLWHMPPLGQAVMSDAGIPTTHFWPEPIVPFPGTGTLMVVHLFVPAHGSGVRQSSLGASVHEKVQFVSQPVPRPLAAPKSHCSGGSTIPSPQLTEMQLPDSHT
jgi:hypothetical protein